MTATRNQLTTRLLASALTGAALLVLRGRAPTDAEEAPGRPYPGYPVTAVLFVLAECGVVCGAFADPLVRGAAHVGLVWIVVAVISYYALFRSAAGDR